MNCYSCGVKLKPKSKCSKTEIAERTYSSIEHIIPNFCGGMLKSKDLLCAKCNSEFNEQFENSFRDQMILSRLFPLNLDRGKQKESFLKAKTIDSKEEVLISKNHNWRWLKNFDYKLSPDGQIEEIRALDIESAKKGLLSLKKNFPNIDVEKEIKQFKQVEEFLPEKVFFENIRIGEQATYRSIAKIAVNYYLYKYPGRSIDVYSTIEYVKGNTKNNCTAFYYPVIPVRKLRDNELSHLLILKSNPNFNLLYCYIELFSTTNFIVILNHNYVGGEIKDPPYCYDVLEGKELPGDYDINLLRDPISNLLIKGKYDIYMKDAQDQFAKLFNRTLSIYEKIIR